MSATLAFLGTLLLSLFVALLAALQLADYFGTAEELFLVLIALPAFVLFCMIVLTLATAAVKRLWLFNWIALLLALVACAPFMLSALTPEAASWLPIIVPGGRVSPIVLEFVVPALIAVLVQWGLIRRRWLRGRGEDDLSRWPWLTTLVAGLAILNPIALDMLGQALTFRPGIWQRDIVRTIAFGAAGTLIAMALIEYYVRSWIWRRRQTQNPQPVRIGATG